MERTQLVIPYQSLTLTSYQICYLIYKNEKQSYPGNLYKSSTLSFSNHKLSIECHHILITHNSIITGELILNRHNKNLIVDICSSRPAVVNMHLVISCKALCLLICLTQASLSHAVTSFCALNQYLTWVLQSLATRNQKVSICNPTRVQALSKQPTRLVEKQTWSHQLEWGKTPKFVWVT